MGRKIIYTSFSTLTMTRNSVATKFVIASLLKITGIEQMDLKTYPSYTYSSVRHHPSTPQPIDPSTPFQYSVTSSVLVNKRARIRLGQFQGCSRFPDQEGSVDLSVGQTSGLIQIQLLFFTSRQHPELHTGTKMEGLEGCKNKKD